MRQEQVKKFMATYQANLEAAIKAKPEDYAFPTSLIPTVCQRMEEAFVRGSYNYTGHAIKLTCKDVGIKHTRKSMEEYFNRTKD